MKKNFGIAKAISFAAVAAAFAASAVEADPAKWVDPRIGASANGHTTAAAAYPLGLVQAGPDTGNFGWDYCSGYRDADRALHGFSHTHLSGTGCPDFADLLILPYTGADPSDRSAVPFLKETEIAAPGRYAVTLADGTRCETAVTPHCAVWRFTFAAPGRHSLLVDPQWGMDSKSHLPRRVKSCAISPVGDKRLKGKLRVTRWVERDFAFVLETDAPRAALRELPKPDPAEKAPRLALDFDLGDARTLTVRVAVSAKDEDAASRNFDAEIAGRSLEDVAASARAEWNKYLSLMEIPGADDAGKTSFYTSLYHLFFQPNDIADAGEAPYYSTFSTWDTFRAAHPLYAVLTPDKARDFVDSMLRQGRDTGYLPVWTLWGRDNQCMIGTHSIPVIVDCLLMEMENGRALCPQSAVEGDAPCQAYWRNAYEQIKDTLTKPHPGRIKERWDLLDKYGYYPFDEIKGESVSRTLECAYDDACAARMARALGLDADAAFFERRAANWRNVLDAERGLVRGKDSKGAWREPFNPYALGHGADTANDFTEGNSWQYTWHVMQDPEGLVAALGGKAAFAAKLDSLFRQPEMVEGMGFTLDVSGLIGQYAHGNEPSHHTIYFFRYADRPDRTAELVREVFDKFYLPKPDGLCGNDDCGQMSAWYLFSAAGFYPFDPCGGDYVIGAPQFPEVVFNLPGGRKFRVVAENLSRENKYVESVALNGEPLGGFILKRADVAKGGELRFKMTNAAR